MEFSFTNAELTVPAYPIGIMTAFLIAGVVAGILIFANWEHHSKNTKRALAFTIPVAVIGFIISGTVLFTEQNRVNTENSAALSSEKGEFLTQFISEADRLYGLPLTEAEAAQFVGGKNQGTFRATDFTEGKGDGQYWDTNEPVELFHDNKNLRLELAWVSDEWQIVEYEAGKNRNVTEIPRVVENQ